MTPKETPLGFEIETPEAFFFFGKKDASLANLTAAYPRFQWARVKQTHSDLVVRSDGPWCEPLTEADAHWTRTPGLALLISTADCTPVLLHHPGERAVAAVHAGWRGVASRIVPKTLAVWRDVEGVQARVGPHIQLDSFEVEDRVREELLRSVSSAPPSAFRVKGGGKSDVDLDLLVRLQLGERLPPQAIDILRLDTKTDDRFHSHRRDREKAGRQLSFVALKSN